MATSEDRSSGSPADPLGPLVSVITVNHNGSHLLPGLLESLRRQTYWKHEVVVVDNASTDGSVGLVGRDFPEARVLEQSKNLGFAGGNNAGIRATKGDFLALVNNDTVADPTWLEELVRTALEDPRIAAVGSKILFLRPFLPVRLVVDGRGLLFAEESGFVSGDYEKPIYKEGFGAPELAEGLRVRAVAAEATVYLPIPEAAGGARLRLVVSTGGAADAGRLLAVNVGSTRVATLPLAEGLSEHSIDVPAAVVEVESFEVINNAGTALSAAGEAADRGIYEPDRGQYDREEDIAAVCGAAALLRRSALEEVGYFDQDFFLYYEDTDLSWRLRRAGYRLRYQPRSSIHHRHAASSVEWSPLFTFYTARNRILMIAKNGGPALFLRAYAWEIRHLAGLFVRGRPGRRDGKACRTRRKLATWLRVQLSLVLQVPRALLKRVGFLTGRPT